MAQVYVSGPVHVFLVLPSGLTSVAIGGGGATTSLSGGGGGTTLRGFGAPPSASPSGMADFVSNLAATAAQRGGSSVGGASITVATRTAFYLGTTRGKPRHRTRYEYSPVMNDLGGGKIGTDYLYQGSHAFISHDFTRWNSNVHGAALSVPNALGVPGTNVAGDIGTAMVLEGGFVGVVWLYPYVLKAAMAGFPSQAGALASGAMPAGYFWPICLLEEAGEERGTEENSVNLLYHAIRAYTPLGAFLTWVNGVPSGVTLNAIN